MSFTELLSRWQIETRTVSLPIFAPELMLCGTAVLLLLIRVVGWEWRVHAQLVCLSGSAIAFALAWRGLNSESLSVIESREYFGGMLRYDLFAAFMRLLLLLFLVLAVALSSLSGLPDREDSPDFYVLLLSGMVGLLLLTGANHLLIVFLGIEMSSVPGYMLAGFLKGQRRGSEGALKYVVYGAGSAGVMLYGISLLAGLAGTAMLPELGLKLTAAVSDLSHGAIGNEGRLLLLSVVMVFAGLAFKLSLVPFHFWCPDVFEGAPAEVAAFLAIASKAGTLALCVRLVFAMVPVAAAPQSLWQMLAIGLGLLAAVSMTYGTLTAYLQTNLKRLLAYSSVAQAGYLIVPVVSLIAMRTGGFSTVELQHRTAHAIEALLFYQSVSLLMTLGAFAVTAFMRNQVFSEELDDWRGAGLSSPLLAVAMGLCLFSLIGIPPFGGFFAKWAVFATIYESARDVHPMLYIPLAAGVLNTVLSLFYYMNILRVMLIVPRPAEARRVALPPWSWEGGYLMVVTAPVLLLGLFPHWLSQLVQTVGLNLASMSSP